MISQYVEKVVDLTDPLANRILNMTIEEARQRVLHGAAEAVREIDGSFALLGREGKTVRMARSLDRPMRYFLAKRQEGPALIVADRIDAIYREDEGKKLRKSHENPDVLQLYAEFLGQPLGEKSHHLLHTHYTPRERV